MAAGISYSPPYVFLDTTVFLRYTDAIPCKSGGLHVGFVKIGNGKGTGRVSGSLCVSNFCIADIRNVAQGAYPPWIGSPC